jgi:hypothetical protein
MITHLNRNRLAVGGMAAFLGGVCVIGTPARGQYPMQPVPAYAPSTGVAVGQPDLMSYDVLEAVLAPVALYPDVLLAQVLTASTYPLDVVQAARWLRSNPDRSQVLGQPWDPSVMALTNYPDVIFRLDQDLDWTNALGSAFLNQQPDVMRVVQELRRRAQSTGVLQTTPQQTVIVQNSNVTIVPAQPQVIYVPQYNPQVVFVEQPVIVQPQPLISFSAGFALGGWLDLDFNWIDRDVVWCRPGAWHGWGYRSRPEWDDWARRVGPRRGFGDWDHGDRGFGGRWHRQGPAPRPAFIGRFATRDSRRDFAIGIRRGNVNIGVRVNVGDRDRDRDRDNDRDRNRGGFRGWDDNDRGRDRGTDRDGRRGWEPRTGANAVERASERGRDSRKTAVRSTGKTQPKAGATTPRSTIRRPAGTGVFGGARSGDAKRSSERGKASRSGAGRSSRGGAEKRPK